MSRKGTVAAGVGAAGAAVVFGVLADGWTAFGGTAQGDRAARMEASPQFSDGVFTNPQPLWNDVLGSLTAFTRLSDYAEPDSPIPVVRGDGSLFSTPPASGLRVTWLGHSTQLIEIDGVKILTDPVFGGRASPVDWAGPKAWYEPPIPLDAFPVPDAVVISHDHYDHLQLSTIERIKGWDTIFVVPLGVGAHLEYWGVPPERIVELDWWEETMVKDLRVVCAPARHASGRQILDQNRTLWSGWAFIGAEHRAFFSGDTGLFPGFKEIGERLGPFDVTMIEVGAYNKAWPDWHIGPEQALRAHEMLGGKVFIPVHWGLWNLAMHGWTEPAERVVAAARAAGVDFAVPRPGQSVEPSAIPAFERWWPEIPWDTAEQHPIVSTLVDPEPAAAALDDAGAGH